MPRDEAKPSDQAGQGTRASDAGLQVRPGLAVPASWKCAGVPHRRNGGSDLTTGRARHGAVAILLVSLAGMAGWTATATGSTAGVSLRGARPANRAAPSPCGRAVLTIFLDVIDEGATFVERQRPPGVPLPPGEGARSPQAAARAVASNAGFAPSSCGYETSSFVTESVAIFAAFGSLGGKNGFALLRDAWDALPPAKKKAVEQAILDGKPPTLGTSSPASPPRTVVEAVRLVSRSGSAAKVAVTTHFVEAVSNSATETYLVSLIRRRWYVSALGDVGASLG